MIYFPNTLGELFLYIPNVYGRDGGTLDLTLKDNVGLEVFSESVNFAAGPNFLTATITPGILPEGEYTYTASNGEVYSEGLLIVGDYIPSRTEKETTITYEQYGN